MLTFRIVEDARFFMVIGASKSHHVANATRSSQHLDCSACFVHQMFIQAVCGLLGGRHSKNVSRHVQTDANLDVYASCKPCTCRDIFVAHGIERE